VKQLKEANETKYWIKLLIATGFMDEKPGNSLLTDLSENIRILVSILKTSRKRMKN